MSETQTRTPLDLLIIEDDSDDLTLLLYALRAGGLDPRHKQVQSQEELEAALKERKWDVVICDYSLPSFNAEKALEMVKSTGVPMFVVSGAISEEVAGRIMRAGAQDYIMKGNLQRLVPAIFRELEATQRREAMNRDLREKEDQLRHAMKLEAIGRLAGGIAHDFNNYLGALMLMTETLQIRLEEDTETATELQNIVDTLKKAASLPRQLLTFSRQQPARPVSMSLNSSVQEMHTMLKRILGERIDFKIELSEDLRPVFFDPAYIEQTLLNLVVNSKDAVDGKGWVRVATRNESFNEPASGIHGEIPPGNYAVLSVEDSGRGMSPGTIKHIFEPFFTTKGDSGTGLGLSTVFGIVKQANGHLNVVSTLGQGTLFEIFIPAHTEPATKSATPAPLSPSPTTQGLLTVLLVEDQEPVRRAISGALSQLNYSVVEAANPEEGLAVLEDLQRHIDLLITDYNMPEGNGPELIRKIAEPRPSLKFILMSGFIGADVLEAEGLTERVHFLQKPFSLRTLTEAAQELLKK